MSLVTGTTPRNNDPAVLNNLLGLGQRDSGSAYRVKAGDTMDSVAKQFGLPIDSLWGANPQLGDVDQLRAGQELNIPPAPAANEMAARATDTATRTPADRATSVGARATANASADSVRARLEQQAGNLSRGNRGPDVKMLQDQLRSAGFDPGASDGIFGPRTERAVKNMQSANNLRADGVVGPRTRAALAQAPGTSSTRPNPTSPTTTSPTTTSPTTTAPTTTSPTTTSPSTTPTTGATANVQPNATALAAAKRSAAGQAVEKNFEKNRAIYEEASRRTGVPASMIAALHANESSMGTNRRSVHGPESGFGLDDRFVTNAWGNQKLAQHGLGPWERGTGTERSKLQSAVVAAEHLKRQASLAGVQIGPNMTPNQAAAAITSYVAGPGAGKRALQNGRSFMFDTADNNPHVMHPGGTSRGPGGTTIRVAPSRKEGLLRWDVLLPMMDEKFRR